MQKPATDGRGTGGRTRYDDPVYYGSMQSPVGRICVALDGRKLVALGLRLRSERAFCNELSQRLSKPVCLSEKYVRDVLRELKEYFAGKRTRFTFSPDFSGHTDFQKRILRETAKIPYGQTRTYGWLADRAGSSGAARAVGQVMARNPVPIVVPCHRVLGSNGDLCGFGGGAKDLATKRKLLALEGVAL